MPLAALRVLALCARKIENDVDIDEVESVESDMIFLGLVGIMDPSTSRGPGIDCKSAMLLELA